MESYRKIYINRNFQSFMEISVLEGLGLSKGEIKVYLTLLRIGSTKVGKIIEKSNMVSSAVHNSLNSLLNKGLISFTKSGKIKYYQAVPPKQLVDFIEGKKEKILKILPELEAEQILSKEKQEAEIFVGIKGVTTMLNLLIENSRRGDEYLFFAVNIEEHNEEIQKFFLNYDAKRKAKGLLVKGLASKELESLFEGRNILKMKYAKFPIPSNISIFKNKTALFSWGEKPIGCIIISEQISEMFRDFFNNMWKIS